MPQPRGKILTAFTLTAKTLRLYITDTTKGDTSVDITVAAGTYYMAGDCQSDDFLWYLMNQIYTAFDALAAGGGKDNYNGSDANGKPIMRITKDHKVEIIIGGDEYVKWAWTEQDGSDIADILGFDSSADDENDATTITGDYQHAYGFYLSEDGQNPIHETEDHETAQVMQAVAVPGQIKTQYLDSQYTNAIDFAFLPRDVTFSNGVSYGAASVDPYARNKGLECWWREARTGKQFRFYRFSRFDAEDSVEEALADERGTLTSGSTTTLADTSKTLTIEPQEHKGKLLAVLDWGPDSGQLMSWYVTSHTADTYTVPNALHNRSLDATASGYRVYDGRYRTYVVDLGAMKSFAPRELPGIDRYDISIPVRKYVA